MSTLKRKKGRQPRVADLERKVVGIKLTMEEYKRLKELAEPYKGNLNKYFRAKIFGERS